MEMFVYDVTSLPIFSLGTTKIFFQLYTKIDLEVQDKALK